MVDHELQSPYMNAFVSARGADAGAKGLAPLLTARTPDMNVPDR